MNDTFKSIGKGLYANRLGLLIFGCLSLVTAVVLATSTITAAPKQSDQLTISTKLSQTKLVKGDVSTVYLDVSITPPGTTNGQLSAQARPAI